MLRLALVAALLGHAALADAGPRKRPAAAATAKSSVLRVVRVMPEDGQAVLVQRGKKGERVVTVGDQIAGYTLIEVDEAKVTVGAKGKLLVLKVPPRATAPAPASLPAPVAVPPPPVTVPPPPVVVPPPPVVVPPPPVTVRPVAPPAPEPDVPAAPPAPTPAPSAPAPAATPSIAAPAPTPVVPTVPSVSEPAPLDTAAPPVPAPAPATVGPVAPVPPSPAPATVGPVAPATPAPAPATVGPAAPATPAPAPATVGPVAPAPAVPAPATTVDAAPATVDAAYPSDPAPTPAPAAVGPAAPSPAAPAVGPAASTSTTQPPPAGPAPVDPYAAAPRAPSDPYDDATPRAAHAPGSLTVELSRRDIDAAIEDFGSLVKAVRVQLTDLGARIDHVVAGSLFARAGLRVGDVVVAVDGKPIRSLDDAAELYARAGTVRSLELRVIRNGATIGLHVIVTGAHR